MELGQMIFGNEGPAGCNYPVDRGLYTSAFEPLWPLIDPHNYGAGRAEFENEVFRVFPYYWGDCMCGFEDQEAEWANANPHHAGCWQERYDRHSQECGELFDAYSEAQGLYEMALRWGVPKELARVHLPVGRYSRMRASANLRNWLSFLTLRMDDAAQWEIRQYANALGNIIAKLFPRTWALFEEGFQCSASSPKSF